MATLRINNLSIARGSRLIIRNLNWQLGRGEIGVVYGANGSGKTTLLRCLAGRVPVAAGGFTLDGVRGGDDRLRYYIGHRLGLVPVLSARANLRLHASLLGVAGGHDRYDKALTALGVDALAEWEVRQLSQGQQRRIALSRLALIAHETQRLWLLDEAYAGLDGEASAHLTTLITAYCGKGGAVVITTHSRLKFPRQAIRELHLTAKPNHSHRHKRVA